jgi:S-formylglutathione hydrolase FrmB
MVLAMPSDGLAGDGTGYVRQTAADYEPWIVRDVPSVVRQVVHGTAPVALGPLFLAGLSMGGFGALRLGARYGRQVFQGLSGLSSITQLDEFRDFVEEPLETYGLSLPGEGDLSQILVARRKTLPPFRFDCGRDDPLLAGNRSLHQTLETASVEHQYEEFEGGHDWDYWRTHLKETLVFFQRLIER